MIYANSVKLKFMYNIFIFKRKLNEIMSKEETKKIVARAKDYQVMMNTLDCLKMVKKITIKS